MFVDNIMEDIEKIKKQYDEIHIILELIDDNKKIHNNLEKIKMQVSKSIEQNKILNKKLLEFYESKKTG